MNSRNRPRGEGLGSSLRDLQTQIRASDIALGIRVLATKSGNPSAIPRTHMVERENQCLQVSLTSTYTLWHVHTSPANK